MSKRPVGLIAIVTYKAFVASLLAVTAIALWFTLKNHELLQQFSESYTLSSKLSLIDLLLVKVLNISPKTLKYSAVAAALYASLTAVEAIGLWYQKVWAEILVIVLVSLSIPVEIWELFQKVSPLKFLVFLGNLAILGYLIYHFKSHKKKREIEQRSSATKLL